LPGTILRSAYREWGWKFPVYRLPLGEEIARSVFSAAVLNGIWCALVPFFGYEVVYRDVLILLLGGTGLQPGVFESRLTAIASHTGAIAIYFATIYAAAALIRIGARRFVRGSGLDLRWPFFRFDNFWHYALNAELPLFGENRDAYAEIARVPVSSLPKQEVVVRLSCVVNHGSNSFVYEGTPFDYFFDRSGVLEKIIVRDVTYAKLYDFSLAPPVATAQLPAAPVQGPLSVDAGVFVLHASDIHNVAIQYFYLPEEPVSELPNEPVIYRDR
jgi:hypothetical protein